MRDKKKIISIIVFIILLLIGMYISFIMEDKDTTEVKANESPKEEAIVTKILKVDIKGSVVNPGVYEVNEGDRVVDVILLAGGLKKDANTSFINLGKRVTDEMTIWIYTNKEIEELKPSIIQYIEKECNCPSVENSACISDTENINGKININTATLAQLMTLPGIGESKAQAIISYREKQRFTTIDDIKNVSGIGASSYEALKDLITV